MKHIIKAGCTAGVDMLTSYFLWMIRYSRKPKKYPLEKRFRKVSRVCKHVLRKLNCDLYITGSENIPSDIACFFPNHQSAFDALTMVVSLKQPSSFVCKKEIYKYFLLGRAARCLEAEFMDRDDLRQSLKVMMRVKDDLTARTKNWIIFPEGTRVKEVIGPIGNFHHGSFKPAMSAKVPIVPVAIYGSFRVLKTKPEFKRYPVQISFLKPIMPEEYEGKTTQEIAQIVQNRVQAEIMFKLRPTDHELMSRQKSKKYKFNLNY